MSRLFRLGGVAFAVLIACGTARAEQSGELRLRLDPMDHNPASAAGLAARLADITQPERSSVGIDVLLQLRLDAVFVDVQITGRSDRDGNAHGDGRVNELYWSAPSGGYQLSAGRRVVQWDVGTVYRPNDLVEQDQHERELLLPGKPQGRSLLQADRFSADETLSLVWVNPQNVASDTDTQRGAAESALAAMAYRRFGATDAYGFARVGQHTGLSLGAAAVAVVSDSLSLHGSVRALQRHDGWVDEAGAASDLMTANPWRQATLGGTGQALLGASWTGERRQSVIVEYWYDGTAPSDAQWDRWQVRTDALAAQVRAVLAGQGGALPAVALAGNLAWQDTPLQLANRRRETIFLRLAWQPEPWLLSLDTLYNPADAGRITTVGLQWQGDRMRVNAALRLFGGPSTSLTARLPQRYSGLVAVIWTY